MKKSIVCEDKKLVYVIRGKGMPVLLLHGLAEDGTIWDNLAFSLENDYTVITPDFPGSGKSALTTVLSIESMADAVKAILDEENISDVVIIGHSMGGYVSLAFAERYPEAVRALGLFHSSGFADDEDKIASREKNIAFINAHGTLAYLKQATPTLFGEASKQKNPGLIESLIDRYRNFNPAALVAYQEAMIKRPARLEILKKIVKPVLMIMGKEDKAITYELSLKQSHLPSCSYLHVLEFTGHMGMLEEFDRSKKILQDFLADLP